MPAPQSSPKVASAIAALRDDVQTGRLTGRLPGMRALAERLGVSTFVIFQAVAGLEAEGLLESLPRRGVQVRHAVRVVRLVVCERLAWQRAFWHEAVQLAQTACPGLVVEVVHPPSDRALPDLLADNRPTVLANLSSAASSGLPLRDISHVIGAAMSAKLRAEVVPLGGDVPLTLIPMTIQIPALIVAGDPAGGLETDWIGRIAWLRDTQGPGRMVPPAVATLAESLGLEPALASKSHEQVVAVAVAVIEIIAAFHQAGILGDSLGDPTAIANGFESGTISAAIRASFLWPGFGLGRGRSARPLPGPYCPGITLGLGISGSRADAAIANLIGCLTGEAVQRLHMVRGLGCSPYAPILQGIVRDDRGCAPGMAAVAAQVLAAPVRSPSQPVLPILVHMMTDRIVLPLLRGAMSRSVAIALTRELVESVIGPSSPSQSDALRLLLLTEN